MLPTASQDLEQNRPVEAREHVRRFHELFFTLSPDKGAIEGNIQRAMFLSDRSAYAHYRDLAEQGYYNRVISGNMNQRIGIDSVKCDFDTYPYEVVTYARLSIIREKSVTERSLVTRGRLLNSTRSDNNPHGFILEAFRVVENRDDVINGTENHIEIPDGEQARQHHDGHHSLFRTQPGAQAAQFSFGQIPCFCKNPFHTC